MKGFTLLSSITLQYRLSWKDGCVLGKLDTLGEKLISPRKKLVSLAGAFLLSRKIPASKQDELIDYEIVMDEMNGISIRVYLNNLLFMSSLMPFDEEARDEMVKAYESYTKKCSQELEIIHDNAVKSGEYINADKIFANVETGVSVLNDLGKSIGNNYTLTLPNGNAHSPKHIKSETEPKPGYFDHTEMFEGYINEFTEDAQRIEIKSSSRCMLKNVSFSEEIRDTLLAIIANKSWARFKLEGSAPVDKPCIKESNSIKVVSAECCTQKLI